MIRRHSGSAREPIAPIGSPRRTTRVIPSGTFAVKLLRRPTTMFARFFPGGRETGTSTFFLSRSHSSNSPGGKSAWAPSFGGVSIFTISYG